MSNYIRFEVMEKKPKTNVYGIFSLSDESLLGQIYWYSPWRQYVFDSYSKTIWNDGCLEEVTNFLKELKEERKRKK